MEKIQTAEELILERVYVTQDGVDDVHDSVSSVADAMIEFAKLHVEAALKEASEKAKVEGYTYNLESERKDIDIYGIEMSVDEICSTNSGLFVRANKDSILNSYSLDNIK